MARAVMAVRAARGDDKKPVKSASKDGARAPETAKPATDGKQGGDAKDNTKKPNEDGAP